MKRFIISAAVLASFAAVRPALAQEAPGPGRAEITIIPAGVMMFTENADASAPAFDNYQLGGAVAYNINNFLGVEGEVSSSVGISQSLDFGYPSSERTPDALSYSGNVVLSLPSGGSVVPYVTGGVGGISVFSRESFGINETETRFASNVGGGVKWYAGRWGLRGDYRFMALPSVDSTSAFLGFGRALRTPGVRGGHAQPRTLKAVLLEAALNGTRAASEHPAIPVGPAQQATEARASVAAGATAIHVHVRDGFENEALSAEHVTETVEAIRAACPGVPVGISTGAWIVPDLRRRLALIRSWQVVPDFASVNLHEVGAPEVIRLLIEKGVGVEAGIWNAPAAKVLLDSGLADECERILLEPAEAACWARHNLRQIEEALTGLDRPRRLLHGLGRGAWEFVALAARRGYDARIGFEDTLRLPDGTVATSNAELVAAARRIIEAQVVGPDQVVGP